MAAVSAVVVHICCYQEAAGRRVAENKVKHEIKAAGAKIERISDAGGRNLSDDGWARVSRPALVDLVGGHRGEGSRIPQHAPLRYIFECANIHRDTLPPYDAQTIGETPN